MDPSHITPSHSVWHLPSEGSRCQYVSDLDCALTTACAVWSRPCGGVSLGTQAIVLSLAAGNRAMSGASGQACALCDSCQWWGCESMCPDEAWAGNPDINPWPLSVSVWCGGGGSLIKIAWEPDSFHIYICVCVCGRSAAAWFALE